MIIKPTASALDVAHYILKKKGAMGTMKLQKLVYYCQAWSLVFDERPMFHEKIQAWVHGPVVPELYRMHRGAFVVDADDVPGRIANLDKAARDTIDGVLKIYGNKDAFFLRLLTHGEPPWKDIRKDLDENSPCNRVIPHEAMRAYYSSIVKR